MDWTTKDVLILCGIAVGLVTPLILAFKEIAARVDARRQRKEKTRSDFAENAVAVRRLKQESEERESAAVNDALWKIIGTKNEEICVLKLDYEALVKVAALNRPGVKEIYSKIREIRSLIKDDERSVKDLLDEIEGLLP